MNRIQSHIMTENNRVIEELALELKFLHTHTHTVIHITQLAIISDRINIK